ncbi:hypothetical protein LL912_00960 [Niabella sp. CC-SYL272]|uniref:hypothetical protein n=1 Tax=Niabella agricola TaxID=2891571 RepID=UPI001F26E044|nr:hypothetical protein [Niabella agricola]MCF3107337.1 hypothetical protein [Niabella agricola]
MQYDQIGTRLDLHAETYHQVLKRLHEARIETFVAKLGRDAGILVHEYDLAIADIIVKAVLTV